MIQASEIFVRSSSLMTGLRSLFSALVCLHLGGGISQLTQRGGGQPAGGGSVSRGGQPAGGSVSWGISQLRGGWVSQPGGISQPGGGVSQDRTTE